MYLAKILIIDKGLAICEVGGYMIKCKREQVNMLILVIVSLKEPRSFILFTCYNMIMLK